MNDLIRNICHGGKGLVQVQGFASLRGLDEKGRPFTDWQHFPNGAVTVGLNSLLNVGFRATTQISAWYIGLINESGFSALSAADTSASHSGWSELTDYSSGTRPAWAPNAASGGTLATTSPVSFTINASVSVRGMFLASSSTKSSVVDTLWATAVNGSGQAFTSSQTCQVSYSIVLTPTS